MCGSAPIASYRYTDGVSLDPESLYRQLGQLVADMPDLAGEGPITPEMHQWLARVAVLVAEAAKSLDHGAPLSTGPAIVDLAGLTSAIDGLNSPLMRAQDAHKITGILHRALARAEMNAPATAQGAFIPAGAGFDVFQAISKVLREAKRDVLIVDPYMDAKVLTDFARLAAEQVAVRLLTDGEYTKPEAVQPAAMRWVQQYGGSRPLEVKLTAPRQLHDRLIVVDDAAVWSLTQSLKDFAARSPASILRVEAGLAQLKRDAYAQMWAAAQRLQ